jgi:dUTP pyrophosphatase
MFIHGETARSLFKKNRRKEMKIKLDEGAYMPTRAHEHDAGLDLYSPIYEVVPAKGSAVFDTGVHIELPKYTVGMLKSKSGLNVNHGLTSEGVIDVGYTGSICVKLYNHSDEDYYVQKGDKISQLVILPLAIPTTLELVDDLEATERGNGGFGSTGR